MIALTYDDIQLVPAYSHIESRKLINLETNITERYKIYSPIVAAPMDTVCELEMAYQLFLNGGVGCIHRFMSIEEQVKQVSELSIRIYAEAFINVDYIDWIRDRSNVPIMAAVGANGDYLERAEALIRAGANIILIDVAHGHHKNVREAIKSIKELNKKLTLKPIEIIAGNIATAQAAEDLQEWGANGLRIGVGGGSVCTTRIQTGFGVPNVTCIEQIRKVATVPIIADGGIRTSGDIAKALALGADCVMIGSIIAGTKETPGEIHIGTESSDRFKIYRGAASLETKTIHGQPQRNVEGASTIVPYKGEVTPIIDSLLDGIRSALSYCGAQSLNQYFPEWVQITSAGQIEAKPHLLNKY